MRHELHICLKKSTMMWIQARANSIFDRVEWNKPTEKIENEQVNVAILYLIMNSNLLCRKILINT